MITQENILMHELIGLDAAVVKSNNDQMNGFSGKIIDETKSMIILNSKNGIKKIPKDNVKWKILVDRVKSIEVENIPKKRSFERFGVNI